MLTTAIILAGGFGTRLQSVVNDVPKPMAPVNGEPFLNYQLRHLKKNGIQNAIISTGHLAEKIEDFYGDEFEGLHLRYSREQTPLGTGGATRMACMNSQEKEFLVINGDSFFKIDLIAFYARHAASGNPVSLALRKVVDAGRYGKIAIDTRENITAFKEKSENSTPGLINAGNYIIDRELFIRLFANHNAFSIEKDFFEAYCKTIRMNGFEFDGYFIDIGIPEDYIRAQNDFKGSGD